ncbi:TPA: SLATT domain-containing protein, partial [Escherichia coli]
MHSTFSDKVWWTRKAKIKAERRLLNLDYYSQFLLLWYSSFLVCYSIYSLVKPPANNNESIIMVALSVLILALTLFINNMNYKGRAMLIKQCYEKLSV